MLNVYSPLAAVALLLLAGCATSPRNSVATSPQLPERLGLFRPLSRVQFIEKNNQSHYDEALTRYAASVLLDEFSAMNQAHETVPLRPEPTLQRRLDGVLTGLFRGLNDPRERATARVPEVVRELMEEAGLDYAVGFYQHGYSRTTGNFAWQSLKTAGWLALTFGSTGHDATGQPRLAQALSLSRENLRMGTVVFDRQHDRVAFFSVLDTAANPADEKAVRAQVRRALRGLYPQTTSVRSVPNGFVAN